MLSVSMDTTGDSVALAVLLAQIARRPSDRDRAAECAVTLAQQGLRAARMLGLYPSEPPPED